MSAARPQFSVVIPAYDEEPNIRPLVERIGATFAGMGCTDWEIVFVENGSRDGSLALLQELHAADPRVKYLSLSRNFGHAGAVCCGFDHVTGEHVVLMDGDQQDPPELIAQFWDKMQREDVDVVFGVRARREREPWLKRTGMKWFYRIWRRTSYVHVPLDAGNFCLMRRVVADAIASMRERGRFVPGLRAFVGFKQDGVPFERPPRGGGEAKTSFAILTGIAIEGLLAFSVYPLRLMMIVGVLAMAFSILVSLMLLSFRLLHVLQLWENVPSFTWNSVFMILMAGAQMLGLGVIGEYLGRVYQEVKQRPIYVIRKSGI